MAGGEGVGGAAAGVARMRRLLIHLLLLMVVMGHSWLVCLPAGLDGRL